MRGKPRLGGRKQASFALENNVAPIRSRRFLRNGNFVDVAVARHSKRAFSALALCNGNFVDVAVARHSKRASSALALCNGIEIQLL